MIHVLGASFPTHLAAWTLTGLFGLSTRGNLASRSRTERLVMTPVALVPTVACLVVAAGP